MGDGGLDAVLRGWRDAYVTDMMGTRLGRDKLGDSEGSEGQEVPTPT